MPFHSHTLANGLQIIGETSPSARSAALGFFVRTGSRDETPEVCGVTHFLEHMVFKGTPRRTALDVNRDFDRIGADYNAFTSEENTVFHAAVLPEYLPQAVDILADILRPSLRDDDFDMEKKVIIEEIGMYEDQPMWSAYDNAKRIYFAEHKLGNSILGTPAEHHRPDARPDARLLPAPLRGAEHHRRPRPAISIGRASWTWSRSIAATGRRGRSAANGVRETQRFGSVRGDDARTKVMQEHVFLISPGPPADFAAAPRRRSAGHGRRRRFRQPAVLGAGRSRPGRLRRLQLPRVRRRRARSTRRSAASRSRAEEDLTIVLEVLHEVQRRRHHARRSLNQARNKVLSRVVRGSERPKGRMMAIGMSWTYQHDYRSVDDDLRALRGGHAAGHPAGAGTLSHRSGDDAGPGAAGEARPGPRSTDRNKDSPTVLFLAGPILPRGVRLLAGCAGRGARFLIRTSIFVGLSLTREVALLHSNIGSHFPLLTPHAHCLSH